MTININSPSSQINSLTSEKIISFQKTSSAVESDSCDEFYTPEFSKRGITPKILLIYPKFADTIGRAVNIPINLLYLGSYLKARGVEVKILDALWEEDFDKKFLIEAANVTAIGISPMTFQLPHALKLAQICKTHFKNTPVIFGGVHPTLFAEQIIEDLNIDFVVKGEGEIPTLRILDVVLGLRDIECLTQSPGIGFRKRDSTTHISNEFAELINYRAYPDIDYGLLDPDVLEGYKDSQTLYFPIVTSRGCPYRCTFCINVVVPNTNFRDWTPERVICEFRKIQKVLDRKDLRIWIWDEIYLLNRKRNRSIAELILKENMDIEYTSSARADFFRDGFLDISTLKLLKKSGMTRVSIGVESGSQKVLDYLQKDLPKNLILQSADYCEKAGIRPSYSFMIGLPPEEKEDVIDTINIIGDLSDRLSTWSVVGPQIFRPYPGSTILDDCISAGWQSPVNNQAWIDFVEQENYSPDAYDVPWIKNPGLVNVVYFYTALIALKPKKLALMFFEFCDAVGKGYIYKFFGVVAILSLSTLGKLRIKFGFYKFFFEKDLFGAVRRRYISF